MKKLLSVFLLFIIALLNFSVGYSFCIEDFKIPDIGDVSLISEITQEEFDSVHTCCSFDQDSSLLSANSTHCDECLSIYQDAQETYIIYDDFSITDIPCKVRGLSYHRGFPLDYYLEKPVSEDFANLWLMNHTKIIRKLE